MGGGGRTGKSALGLAAWAGGGRSLAAMANFEIVHLPDVTPAACPCGQARRAFVDSDTPVASMHIVDIKKDSEAHYHKHHTEIYLILEGEGHIELDGELYPVKPMTTVMIKPGCRHRAVGNLKIANIPIPAFDEADEWFD
jgi:mannose-6-phosphate isomerase-like protein (cupin superfamily)